MIQIHKVKLRYCYARNSYLQLKGHGPWERMHRVLADEDVRGINERTWSDEDKEAQERLRELGEIVEGGLAVAGTVAAGEGRHTMSWIWYESGIDGGQKEMDEGKCHSELILQLLTRRLALRVEWCKAYARMRRWHEDIVLIEEEMRRTIEYGTWMGGEWETQTTARSVASPALAEGLRAYAKEHVAREERTCRHLQTQWGGLRAKAAAYLAGVREVGPEVVVDLGVEDVDEDDEEGDVDGKEVVDGTGEEEEEEEED